jgi:hypothetical protein
MCLVVAPLFYTPYPSPFNAEIAPPFRLAEEEEVSLVIYDILGREVRVINAETLPAGYIITTQIERCAGMRVMQTATAWDRVFISVFCR